ncbi:MAG: GNAT family N-acetyltransferase [Oscillospiraceae bacterium]
MKQIFDGIPERLTNSYYGYKIMAAYLAYGTKYDFCKFYSCGDGTIHIYNSSMVIDGNINIDELEMLIKMVKPASIELSRCETLHICNEYIASRRTLYRAKMWKCGIDFSNVKVNSFTERCYDILNESFNSIDNFDLWYVDISHRIRHEVSNLYLFGNTTITKQFNINGFCFLSNIATSKSERGKGTARELLWCLAEKFKSEGSETYLFAFDERKTFYEEIGFEPVYEDIYYEMKG